MSEQACPDHFNPTLAFPTRSLDANGNIVENVVENSDMVKESKRMIDEKDEWVKAFRKRYKKKADKVCPARIPLPFNQDLVQLPSPSRAQMLEYLLESYRECTNNAHGAAGCKKIVRAPCLAVVRGHAPLYYHASWQITKCCSNYDCEKRGKCCLPRRKRSAP